MNFDQDKGSNDEQPLPGDYFPENKDTAEYAKRLGGFDIYKSGKLWMALVVTEDTTRNQKSVKWFRWQIRKGEWKNTLCNMKVDYLDFDEIIRKIDLLKEIYKIK